MLYVIHRQNSDLQYQNGQNRIVHLVSKVGAAIQSSAGRTWAFSDGNAGARFCNNLNQIDNYVDWTAVEAKYWSDPTVKERKQAEFLVYESFPWPAFVEIGVIRQELAREVESLIQNADHQPKVVVKPGLYY